MLLHPVFTSTTMEEVPTFVSSLTFVFRNSKCLKNQDSFVWWEVEDDSPVEHTEMRQLYTIGQHELTKKQINEFRQAFALLDKNGDGGVSKEELGRMMKALGQFARKEELNQIIQEVMPSHNDNIDFETFVDVTWSAGTQQSVMTRQEEEELKDAFRVFDRSGRGYITATDLKKFMRRLGEDLAEDEIDAMIKEADIDRDGRIDFYEFVDALDEPGTEEYSSNEDEE